MNKVRIAGLLLLGLYALGSIPAAENELSGGTSVPDGLRRPQRGEAPRYPQDTVIGPLGRGDAPEGAYTLALDLLRALLRENRDAPVLRDVDPAAAAEYYTALEAIKPQQFRIGGGREEPDGSASFLVRFMGRDQWITGELYLRTEEAQWKLDELILEKPRNLQEGTEPYPFDYSPYERLF
ncbi:MAG: hypothetical protein LBP88_08680 [Treponema sp.]|jgi:hypothetical protein|nr:hypothetical protein [Treponema sp.]